MALTVRSDPRYAPEWPGVLAPGAPDGGAPAAAPAAELDRLITQARIEATLSGQPQTVCAVLEIADASTWPILEDLRRRLGADLTALDLRRAGSSVVVTATVLAWPRSHGD